jgi:hypothetical protein
MRALEPELEAEVMETARRLRRERDPIYWRQKYFELLAINVQRRREHQMWQGMFLVCLLAAGFFLLMKWLFRATQAPGLCTSLGRPLVSPDFGAVHVPVDRRHRMGASGLTSRAASW